MLFVIFRNYSNRNFILLLKNNKVSCIIRQTSHVKESPERNFISMEKPLEISFQCIFFSFFVVLLIRRKKTCLEPVVHCDASYGWKNTERIIILHIQAIGTEHHGNQWQKFFFVNAEKLTPVHGEEKPKADADEAVSPTVLSDQIFTIAWSN